MRRVIRVLFLPIVFAVSAGIGFSRGTLASPPAVEATATTGNGEAAERAESLFLVISDEPFAALGPERGGSHRHDGQRRAR